MRSVTERDDSWMNCHREGKNVMINDDAVGQESVTRVIIRGHRQLQ